MSTLKKGGMVLEDKYKYLYPTAENIPWVYCTPKIHKNNCPLRPIVDYTGTIGYNPSRWLAHILGGLVGKNKILNTWLKNCKMWSSKKKIS